MVQIIVGGSQPSFWAMYGPLIIAAVAFAGVVLTIRTTNKREVDKWRRDTLLKLCSEASGVMQDMDAAQRHPTNHTYVGFEDDAAFVELQRKLSTVLTQLRIVGETPVVKACESAHLASYGVLEQGGRMWAAEGRARSEIMYLEPSGDSHQDYQEQYALRRSIINEDAPGYSNAQSTLEAASAKFVDAAEYALRYKGKQRLRRWWRKYLSREVLRLQWAQTRHFWHQMKRQRQWRTMIAQSVKRNDREQKYTERWRRSSNPPGE